MNDIAAHIDFETRSTVDLKKAGAWRYSRDASTQIICMAWRIGDGKIEVWKPGLPFPGALFDHVASGGRVISHNAPFEYVIWNNVLAPATGAPQLRIEQLDCTMARAMSLALPATLEQAAMALGVRVQKDMEGRGLMMRMCKPRGYDQNGQAIWLEDALSIDRLTRYCETDVAAECEVDAALPRLSPAERRVWELDQRINGRGVMLDIPLVTAAQAAVKEASRRADERMWWLTDGDVKRCTETAKIVAWLNKRGVPCESVAKGEVEEIVLASKVIGDATAEEVIRLRRAAGKSSTAKFNAMLDSCGHDGRVRGTLQYHAASTGRWGGRLIQPQNLPRVDPDRDLPDVMRALDLLSAGKAAAEVVDGLDLLTGDTLGTLSRCLRAMLIAAPGKIFVGGDFSNIEGRVNAWLAGESWKVEAFRDFDAGTGHDLYKLAYARAFGKTPEEVTKAERQIGKVMELALGYQGGVGAFQTMAGGYGIKVTDERADELKRAWRNAHPHIVKSWWALQDASLEAVSSPGITVRLLGNRVAYHAANGFLFCQLPSLRVLAYANPRIVQVETPKGDIRHQVEFDGVDSVTKKWGPQRLYGGLGCENIVQAVARDIMVEAMRRIDSEYPVVLTVHDELLSEVDEGLGDVSGQYARRMSELPAWAAGLPVAAQAWTDKRYVK